MRSNDHLSRRAALRAGGAALTAAGRRAGVGQSERRANPRRRVVGLRRRPRRRRRPRNRRQQHIEAGSAAVLSGDVDTAAVE